MPCLLQAGVARAGLETPVQGLQPLHRTSGVGGRSGQVQPGVRHVRLHPGGEVQPLDGLVEVLGEPVGPSQLALVLGVGGRAADQLREDLDSPGVAGVVEDIAEVLLDGVAAGAEPGGLLQGLDRLRIALQATQGDAKDVPQLRVPGVPFHRPAPDRLGLGIVAVAHQYRAEVPVDRRRGVGIRVELVRCEPLALVAPPGLEGGFGFSESVGGHGGSGRVGPGGRSGAPI